MNVYAPVARKSAEDFSSALFVLHEFHMAE